MQNKEAQPCPICLEDITDNNPNIAVFTCSVDENLHFVCTPCYDQLDKKECPLDRKISDVIFTSINPTLHLEDFEDHFYFYPTFLSGLQRTLGINLTEQTINGIPFLETFIEKLKESEYLPYLIYKILIRDGSLDHLTSGDQYDIVMRKAPLAYAEVIAKSSNNIDLLRKVVECRLTEGDKINEEQKKFERIAYTKLAKLIVFSDCPYFSFEYQKLIWNAKSCIPDIVPNYLSEGIMRLSEENKSINATNRAIKFFLKIDINDNLLGMLMIGKLLEYNTEDATEFYLRILASTADNEKLLNGECRAFAFQRLTSNNKTESPEYNLYIGKYAPNNENILDRIYAITNAMNNPTFSKTALKYLTDLSECINKNQEAQVLIIRQAIRVLSNNKLYHNNIISLLRQTHLLPLFTKLTKETSFWNFLVTQKTDLTTEFAELCLPENTKSIISDRQKDFFYRLITKNMPDIIEKTIASITFNSHDKSYRIKN